MRATLLLLAFATSAFTDAAVLNRPRSSLPIGRSRISKDVNLAVPRDSIARAIVSRDEPTSHFASYITRDDDDDDDEEEEEDDDDEFGGHGYANWRQENGDDEGDPDNTLSGESDDPRPLQNNDDGNRVNIGAIVGGVVGSLAVIALIILCYCLFIVRPKRRQAHNNPLPKNPSLDSHTTMDLRGGHGPGPYAASSSPGASIALGTMHPSHSRLYPSTQSGTPSSLSPSSLHQQTGFTPMPAPRQSPMTTGQSQYAQQHAAPLDTTAPPRYSNVVSSHPSAGTHTDTSTSAGTASHAMPSPSLYSAQPRTPSLRPVSPMTELIVSPIQQIGQTPAEYEEAVSPTTPTGAARDAAAPSETWKPPRDPPGETMPRY
ncbi:hypothetical protein F5Y15DRAFT_15161 [Xylariaceae sp. FL0016]|nr:hypothetical protein F5Y15DRAFT_15161 [Xylariaceae sp. FL0016]